MKQHSPRFLKLVSQAKQRIQEITPQTLADKLKVPNSCILIDVREVSEWDLGHIASSIHLSKGIIERDIEKTVPDLQSEIVVYCSGGFRCALVADALQNMGYLHVFSLEQGLQGWAAQGYPLEV